MKNLAVIFPGIGYTKERPLLYYSKKLARQFDYQVISVSFGELPDPKDFGDPERRKALMELALSRSRSALKDVDFSSYDRVIFISKSLGTVVAAAIAAETEAEIEQLYFTPLEETFLYAKKGVGIVFFGTADPWADYRKTLHSAEALELTCHLYENANHSLETDSVLVNLQILNKIIQIAEELFNSAN